MILPSESLAGSVLVATPLISDPPFARTVVALLEHDVEGALGLIINLPSDLPVDRYLPDTAGGVVAPAVIFVGGPVATDSALGLVMTDDATTIRESPFSGVSIVDPTVPQHGDVGMRVFGGFSGWSPRQLEDELLEGAWWTALAHREDFFTPDPELLWEATVRRVKGRAPLYATFPDDPSTN
jgi:putative transcriptional regulator